jgi:hypothetical protein
MSPEYVMFAVERNRDELLEAYPPNPDTISVWKKVWRDAVNEAFPGYAMFADMDRARAESIEFAVAPPRVISRIPVKLLNPWPWETSDHLYFTQAAGRTFAVIARTLDDALSQTEAMIQ